MYVGQLPGSCSHFVCSICVHISQVEIVESEAIPIAYTAGRCRFYVKAAGEWSGVSTASSALDSDNTTRDMAHSDDQAAQPSLISTPMGVIPVADVPSFGSEVQVDDDALPTAQDILDYCPRITRSTTSITTPGQESRKLEWHLSSIDLAWIAEGCYVLGCGGGGSPHHLFLQLRECVRRGEDIRVVDLGYFDEDTEEGQDAKFVGTESDGMIGWGGGMGSPEVSAERLIGEEYTQAMEDLIEFMRVGFCVVILSALF